MPVRRQWREETKRELWSSSTSAGVWQYDVKPNPSAAVIPATATHSGRDSGTELQYRGGATSPNEGQSGTDTVSSTPSSTILIRQDQEERVTGSETWDTKRQKLPYFTASTLQKTRELDEEVAVRLLLFFQNFVFLYEIISWASSFRRK